MKTFYISLSSENIIRDVIEFEHEGYEEVLLKTPLPIGINGGWFKYENGEIVEYPELKPKDENKEIKKLQQSQVEQDDLIMDIILGRL